MKLQFHMRNLIVAGLILLNAVNGNAQKIIEKHFPFAEKESILFNIQLADSILVRTWSKDEIHIVASININTGNDNDKYQVNFDNGSKNINVIAKFHPDSGSVSYDESNSSNYIRWQIFVPERAKVSIETINGNIVIIGKTAEVKAYTISGYIDISVLANARLDLAFSTIRGIVYTDLDIQVLSKDKDRIYDFAGSLNGGGTPVALKTISGNIFLRKQQ